MKNGKIMEKPNHIKSFNKENLDIILDSNNNALKAPERDLYKEEKDKISAWKSETHEQDQVLVEQLKPKLKILGNITKNIGQKLDLNEKMIDKTNKVADKTNQELKKSNKQLKIILEKVGGPTNFCVDVILVCVCLGLCAVLYNILKTRLFK